MIVMTRQRKKEFNKKNFFHQARPKRFKLLKTRCDTLETVKMHKNWTSIKNVEKSSKQLKIVWEWFSWRNIKK